MLTSFSRSMSITLVRTHCTALWLTISLNPCPPARSRFHISLTNLPSFIPLGPKPSPSKVFFLRISSYASSSAASTMALSARLISPFALPTESTADASDEVSAGWFGITEWKSLNPTSARCVSSRDQLTIAPPTRSSLITNDRGGPSSSPTTRPKHGCPFASVRVLQPSQHLACLTSF